jgi:uncharacterized membrane protein
MWDLRRNGVIVVDDAVMVTWVDGAHRPRIGHLRHQLGPGASQGGVLGTIVRSLLRPSLEPSDLARLVQGSGIDRHFLDAIRSALLPNTSALMVLSSSANLDDVRPVVERGLARGDVSLVHVWLTASAPEILRLAAEDLGARTLP